MGGLEEYSSGYERAHGRDPQRSMQQARTYFQKAIAANPNFAWPWNDSGALEAIYYDWLARHGGSLESLELHLAEAVAKIKRAVEIDPSYAVGYGCLADLYARRAKVAILSGQAPETFLQKATEVSRLGLQINDQDFLLPNNYALAQSVEAKFSYLSGRDPGPELVAVYENADKAMRLKADYAEHYQSRAEAHLIAASYALERGGDVAGEVEQGLQALVERTKHSPNDSHDETLQTRLMLVRARWRVQKSKSAATEWKAGAVAAERALQIDAEDPDAHLAYVEWVRYRVELGTVKQRAADDLFGAGLEAAEQALRQQPWNTFMQAAQAALWLMRGRITRDPAVRRAWRDKGTGALARALQQNHLLEKEYGGLLEANK